MVWDTTTQTFSTTFFIINKNYIMLYDISGLQLYVKGYVWLYNFVKRVKCIHGEVTHMV